MIMLVDMIVRLAAGLGMLMRGLMDDMLDDHLLAMALLVTAFFNC